MEECWLGFIKCLYNLLHFNTSRMYMLKEEEQLISFLFVYYKVLIMNISQRYIWFIYLFIPHMAVILKQKMHTLQNIYTYCLFCSIAHVGKEQAEEHLIYHINH